MFQGRPTPPPLSDLQQMKVALKPEKERPAPKYTPTVVQIQKRPSSAR